MATKNSRKSTDRKPKAGRGRTASGGISAWGTITTGAIIGAVAAGVYGLFKLGRGSGTAGGHVPTDLMGDRHPGAEDRAIDAFRPDPTAPIPASERDAFRPALAGAAAPTLVKGEARENERLDAAPS